MPNCSVCSNPLASYHFGAIVCRACAIFFRRFVFRKKEKVYCNCFLRRDKLCRSCRMEKCLAAGMRKSEIQGPRDNICQKYEILSIEHPLQLRTLDRISEISQNYSNLESSRTTVFQKPTKNRKLDVLEFTVEVMTDVKLIFQFCEKSFFEFRNLNFADKKTIFYNFIIKWNILELSILSKKFNDPTQLFSPSGAVTTTVEDFYSAGNSKISKKEIRDIFEPFWNYRYFNVNRPLVEMKFGDVQNMALFGILLWDPGYTNLSETLSETCHAMRKIIFRELNSFLENSGTFFYTLEALNLIERAEQKCREEIHLCGIHNIEFDQERKNMILWDK